MAPRRKLTIDGVTKLQSEWCREYGIGATTVSNRLASGWPVLKALTTKHVSTMDTTRLTLDGETMIAREWYTKLGISKQTFRARMLAGWSVERMLTKPTRKGDES